MGDAQAPGGYFVGRPANYEEPQDAAADAQNGRSAPAPAPAPAENLGQHQGQDPAPGGQKKPGFLGNLFSCFSGGRGVDS